MNSLSETQHPAVAQFRERYPGEKVIHCMKIRLWTSGTKASWFDELFYRFRARPATMLFSERRLLIAGDETLEIPYGLLAKVRMYWGGWFAEATLVLNFDGEIFKILTRDKHFLKEQKFIPLEIVRSGNRAERVRTHTYFR